MNIIPSLLKQIGDRIHISAGENGDGTNFKTSF